MPARWIFSGLLMFSIGMVQSQNAPVTSLQSYYNQLPGAIIVPVTVTNFTNIGAISLTLEYDPTVLTYTGNIQNPIFSGSLGVGDNAVPSGMRRIIIGWFSNAVSLPDGSSLIDLSFNFAGGYSALQWIDDGASCEYTDENFNTLNDSPFEDYYVNGLVSSAKSLNLTVFIEGLYNTTTHKMNTAEGNAFADEIADEIQVELHDIANYEPPVYASGNVLLSLVGEVTIDIPGNLNSSYYITIKHRNSIETVSAVPVSFAGNEITYNFSDMAAKAYGNNMKQVDNGRWAIFAGDVLRDGSVDTGDMSPVDNDAANFSTGYLPTDVNGDGAVDTGDMTIIDNNAATFVRSILP